MNTMGLERNLDPSVAYRDVVPVVVWRKVPDDFISPQGNLGPGSAALALRGWRPREIMPERRLSDRLAQGWATFARRLALWHERAHSRQSLLDLDDRALRDIGLDRASAHRQGSLPFWRGE